LNWSFGLLYYNSCCFVFRTGHLKCLTADNLITQLQIQLIIEKYMSRQNSCQNVLDRLQRAFWQRQKLFISGSYACFYMDKYIILWNRLLIAISPSHICFEGTNMSYTFINIFSPNYTFINKFNSNINYLTLRHFVRLYPFRRAIFVMKEQYELHFYK